jgi:hypothetical protein
LTTENSASQECVRENINDRLDGGDARDTSVDNQWSENENENAETNDGRMLTYSEVTKKNSKVDNKEKKRKVSFFLNNPN